MVGMRRGKPQLSSLHQTTQEEVCWLISRLVLIRHNAKQRREELISSLAAEMESLTQVAFAKYPVEVRDKLVALQLVSALGNEEIRKSIDIVSRTLSNPKKLNSKEARGLDHLFHLTTVRKPWKLPRITKFRCLNHTA